jgi:hypothetical protein
MSEPSPWDTSGQRDSGQYPVQEPYRHIRKGIGVTAGQLGLVQPVLARPGRLDDASVARTIGVRQGQADGLMLSRGQACRWDAVPGLTPARRAAVREHEAAIGELRRLKAGVLAAAGQLKPVTMEVLPARSGLRLRGAA